VAEIRSLNDSIQGKQAKMALSMANGAQLGWLIDPYSATASIYRPGQQPETLQKLGSEG
jgi:Uma2 family endonuclease